MAISSPGHQNLGVWRCYEPTEVEIVTLVFGDGCFFTTQKRSMIFYREILQEKS